MNEDGHVTSTTVMLAGCPHAAIVLAPLCGRKVGAGAKMLVADAVVDSGYSATDAHPASLHASGLGDKEASVVRTAVNAAEWVVSGVDDVGALVPGGGCCGALVRRHDS